MKRTVILSMIFVLMLLPIVSSLGSFSDYTNFKTPSLYSKYGTIELMDGNIIMPDEKLAEINLTDNSDTCLNDCYATGTITLYTKQSLFDKIEYRYGRTNDYFNGDVKIFLQTGTKDVDTNSIECIEEISKINSSKINVCNNKKITVKEPVYEEYKGQELEPATYSWRIEGKKNPYESVDWVATIKDIRLTQWLDWNSTFNNYLLHYWSFDENNTLTNVSVDLADPDHRSYNVTLLDNNTAVYRTGVNGTGVYFDGSAKYICPANITNNTNLIRDKQFSLNLWINRTYYGSYSQHFLAASANSYFGIHKNLDPGSSNASITAYPGGTTYGTENRYPWNSQWKMITYIFNNSGFYLYEDGTYFGANNAVSINWTTAETNPWCFGANKLNAGGWLNNWIGMIDEVAIFNKSLTTGEIQSLKAGLYYSPLATAVTMSSIISYPAANIITENTNLPIGCNFTASGQLINYITLNVTNSTGSVWYTNYTSVLSPSYNTTWVTTSLNDGYYSIACFGIGNGGVNDLATENIAIDTKSPTITQAIIANKSTISLPVNVTLNYTVTDLVNVSTCWYNTTESATIINISCNKTANVSFSTGGTKTIWYYVNDTYGHRNNSNVSFFINLYTSNISYSNFAVEGENTTLQFNVTANNINTITANLTYNNTVYTLTGTNNGTLAVFTKNITAPYVDVNTNISFNITYVMNGELLYSSTYGQFVYNMPPLNISAGLCTGTPIYYFDFKDEENLTTIPGELEYNFYYGLSNGTLVNTFGKITSTTNFSICINSTLSSSFVLGSGEIFYRSTGYVDRRFYFYTNTNLTNVTGATNITLYDLISSAQTSFKLEIEDTSLNPYENIYTSILRWYPNLNQYKIIDMGKTDEQGSTVTHIKIEDIDYRIGAYYRNGTLIYLAAPVRMVCLSTPCTYTLKISPTDEDYTSFLGVTYTFAFNETLNIWTFTFSDSSLETSLMNMTIFKDTGTDSIIICDDFISGSTGTLTCNTTGYSGTLRAEVYRESSPPVIIAQKVVSIFSSAFKGSAFGLWLSMFIALPIIFLMILVSPIAALVGGVLALIPALYFGSINLGIIGGFAVLAGIVAHFLKRIS